MATTLLIKHGKLKWAWVTGVPLAWDAAVTLTASWQKVFHDDPRIGFFAQRARFSEALANEEVLAPAKDLDQMQAVVTNSTVDGILAGFFALLVVIILVECTRVSVRAILAQRAGREVYTTEVPHVRSHIVAPAGFIPTAAERQAMAGVGARGDGPDHSEDGPAGGSTSVRR